MASAVYTPVLERLRPLHEPAAGLKYELVLLLAVSSQQRGKPLLPDSSKGDTSTCAAEVSGRVVLLYTNSYPCSRAETGVEALKVTG